MCDPCKVKMYSQIHITYSSPCLNLSAHRPLNSPHPRARTRSCESHDSSVKLGQDGAAGGQPGTATFGIGPPAGKMTHKATANNRLSRLCNHKKAKYIKYVIHILFDDIGWNNIARPIRFDNNSIDIDPLGLPTQGLQWSPYSHVLSVHPHISKSSRFSLCWPKRSLIRYDLIP